MEAPMSLLAKELLKDEQFAKGIIDSLNSDCEQDNNSDKPALILSGVVKSLPLTGERLEILEKTYRRLLKDEPTKL